MRVEFPQSRTNELETLSYHLMTEHERARIVYVYDPSMPTIYASTFRIRVRVSMVLYNPYHSTCL